MLLHGGLWPRGTCGLAPVAARSSGAPTPFECGLGRGQQWLRVRAGTWGGVALRAGTSLCADWNASEGQELLLDRPRTSKSFCRDRMAP